MLNLNKGPKLVGQKTRTVLRERASERAERQTRMLESGGGVVLKTGKKSSGAYVLVRTPYPAIDELQDVFGLSAGRAKKIEKDVIGNRIKDLPSPRVIVRRSGKTTRPTSRTKKK